MATLAEMERERGLDKRTVEGPYADRHIGSPINQRFYARDLDVGKTRRYYDWCGVPVVRAVLALFHK